MELDKLFCDGIVLAEERPIRVFGRSAGRVTVRLCGAEASAEPQRHCSDKKARRSYAERLFQQFPV